MLRTASVNQSTVVSFSIARAPALGLAALLLTACGGGGGGGETTTSSTLSGVAAAGAPLQGKVTVKDANGTKRSAAIGDAGSWSVDVSNLTAPFRLLAEGRTGERSYRIASAATTSDINGTVNITPLTDLVAGLLAAKCGEGFFQDGGGSLTNDQLEQRDAELKQALDAVMSAAGVSDVSSLRTTVFQANHTGLDLVLDLLDAKVDCDTDSATVRSRADTTKSLGIDLTDTLSGTLDDADIAAAVTEFTAIRQLMADIVTEQNNSYNDPASNTTLAGLFASSYLHDGVDDSSETLANWAGAYLKIENIVLESIDLSGDKAVIWFNGGFSTTPGGAFLGRAPVQVELHKEGGGWKYAGNQRLADIRVRPYAERVSTYAFAGTEGSISTSDYRGLELYMDIVDAQDASIDHNITQAVVTGPCLGAGVTLTPHPNFAYLFVVSDQDNGRVDTSSCTDAVEKFDYSVEVTYNSGGLTANYTLRTGAPLFTADEASFTTITTPATAYALAQVTNANELPVTWQLPQYYTAGELDARMAVCGGSGGSGATENIMTANGSKTLDGTTFTFDVIDTCTNSGDHGWLSLRAHDPLGRYVYTTYRVERQ